MNVWLVIMLCFIAMSLGFLIGLILFRNDAPLIDNEDDAWKSLYEEGRTYI